MSSVGNFFRKIVRKQPKEVQIYESSPEQRKKNAKSLSDLPAKVSPSFLFVPTSIGNLKGLSRSNPSLHTTEKKIKEQRRKSLAPTMRESRDVSSPRGTLFVALFDYEARTKEDLNFSKDDTLELIGKPTTNWWLATNLSTGEEGFVPSNYIAEFRSLKSQPWYFASVSRSESERLLIQEGNRHSAFLVRTSETRSNEYSLSVRDGDLVKHYKIKQDLHGRFHISGKNCFFQLHQLVDHYKEHRGLCCLLGDPCTRVAKPVTWGLSYNTVDTWQIQREQIHLTNKLGSGNFGDVYRGVWNKTTEIAVKTLKPGSTKPEDFLKEAQVMKKLRHPNLIQLYGVVTDREPFFIVTEYLPYGSLLRCIREEMSAITLLDQINIAAQVCSGMSYLESQQFIHRDLAARNVLVGDGLMCKVADFGLSRILQENEYLAHKGSKFPIKWTAPEALWFNKFTVKSDVWSFGVFLFEVLTRGAVPYPEFSNSEVMDLVIEGYRMPRPKRCPQEIYSIMTDCWTKEPRLRPSFFTLLLRIEEIYAKTITHYPKF